jgi:hypothetical protein
MRALCRQAIFFAFKFFIHEGYTAQKTDVPTLSVELLDDLKAMIDQARETVSSTVNTTLVMLYWHVGSRIQSEVLQHERAEYGKRIVATVSRQLTGEYGNSFTEKNLRRMVQFAQIFPENDIVVSLIRQLTWTHFIALIPITDPLKRDFYAEMCRVQRWNVRTLRKQIGSMLFERTALSKKPESLVEYEIERLRKEDRLSPDLVFRDPYFLGFLNLSDRYVEKDLEDAILQLATATGHLILSQLQRYTHMDAEVTKKFSKYISERIFQERGEEAPL